MHKIAYADGRTCYLVFCARLGAVIGFALAIAVAGTVHRAGSHAASAASSDPACAPRS